MGPEERPRKRAAMLAVPVALAAALAGGGVAWAAVTDNMYPTANTDNRCNNMTIRTADFPCRTDNRNVSYYMDSHERFKLEAGDKRTVRGVMRNQYAPTDLRISYDSTPTFSGSGETDVIYQEGRAGLPSGADGITWCNDAVNGARYKCDQQYIRIRGRGHYTPGLTCHETGHAVGLQHGRYSSPRLSDTDSRLGCMVTPVGYSVGLGANNRDNINGTY
ncbi:hypothetical protein O4J56_15330 [Nocardiopsis sp. RSe5-2]|uniref:Matrixin family metalloprotease n=1 Tax=Nocardiopsis endophytica TaxID=3018445 RepID=A0ABT4U6A7_9ACTN|nr:hypothetical protein [Nocardiopsis endophytica]MDA2812014.1 hypothetical protein [Nocardiopsis endophytica]